MAKRKLIHFRDFSPEKNESIGKPIRTKKKIEKNGMRNNENIIASIEKNLTIGIKHIIGLTVMRY